MNHFYRDIPGFFTWPDYYRWVASQAKAPWHGVEVGVYTGQSAAFLAVELSNGLYTNKKLDLVDLELTRHGALANLAPIMHTGIIGSTHECDSVEASRRYDDGSLDFILIDAEHDYANVRRDIDAWLPKVRENGGIIAGHDHCPDFTGVMQAVTETFPRYEVFRGERGPEWGDKRMQDTGQYYAVWSVRV